MPSFWGRAFSTLILLIPPLVLFGKDGWKMLLICHLDGSALPSNKIADHYVQTAITPTNPIWHAEPSSAWNSRTELPSRE